MKRDETRKTTTREKWKFSNAELCEVIVKVANTLDEYIYTVPSPWPCHVRLLHPYLVLELSTRCRHTITSCLYVELCIGFAVEFTFENWLTKTRFWIYCFFFTFISIVYLEYKRNQELNKVQLCGNNSFQKKNIQSREK